MEKVAVVTGSSRGIGLSTAKKFASEGFGVVVCSRNAGELKKAESEIKSVGGTVLAVKCDIRNYSQVKSMFQKTVKRFGRIDVLVNNAGVLFHGMLEEMKAEEIDEQIDTNLKGLAFCTREAIGHMKSNGGIIVNVASGAGHYAFENLSVYSATKFAVNAFTTAVSKEVRRYGIQVYSVCPGAVATSMQEKFVGKGRYSVAKHLMIPPEKIAGKIFQLANGEIKISSGSCINVYF